MFGTIFNLFFTAALHRILSGQMKTFALVSVWECVAGLFTKPKQGMLFLSFECFVLLCTVLFFTQNSRSYQSDLMKVTDEIEIPVPVGQFQHGSSRWMREEEKDRVFEVCTISPTNPVIKELIDTGYEGLDFLKDSEMVDIKAAGEPEDRELSGSFVPIDEETEKEADERKENEETKIEETDEGYEIVEYAYEKKEPEQGKDVPACEEKRKGDGQDPYRILKEGGIVIGMTKCGQKEKIHYIADDTHTLTIGATRSGKTRTLVLQSICLMALAGESLVISDPKAELYQYAAPFLEKLRFDVICLDFKNPEKSSRYNLLQPIIDAVNRGEMDKAEMYAWDITNILVGDNTSNEKIWENGEKSTIAAAILCVVVDNAKRPEYQNLTNVYWFVAEMCKAVGNKTPMQEYVKKLRPGHPARALLSISDVAPSRTKGSFYTSALTTLRLFTSRAVYSITHKSDYDIADIGKKKQALFFILPDEKTTYYPIASLALLPFYYVKFTASRHKKQINTELETALSMITTSYLRNKNTIIRAIEENLPYLNPPVSEVFRNFLMEAKLINSNTAEALEGLKKGMDNVVFHEWVDAVTACQDDYNLKNTLPPIVSKLSDMRVVSAELDLLIYEPVKEYITMIILLLGSIPLLYFLNRDWYETLMFTGFGKVLLAISGTVVFVSVAAVSKHIRPIEYKR